MKKLYLAFMLGCLAASKVLAQGPVLSLGYDEATHTTTTTEGISGSSFPVRNNFNRPERVSGIHGNALRLDGFSTWVEGNPSINFGKEFTLETWVNLESYPSDTEVPYASLTPSAIVSQFSGNSGYQLGINTFGVWFFKVSMNGQVYTVQADEPFPLYRWVHVAAVVDASQGSIKLYLNGAEVKSASIPRNSEVTDAHVPLFIGKSNNDKYAGIFLVNALSAAIDQTRLYSASLSAADIQSHYQTGAAQAALLRASSLEVPASRFSADQHYPTFHALPPANWTNEPHGLMKHKGLYHMFYQRTPNGPYKYQMHWGHMVSKDMVHWQNVEDALWPTLEWSATDGYDMKGIWSGDVITHEGKAYAYYTSVNHGGSYNPAISLTTSTGDSLLTWKKHGPIISKEQADDFRDPFIWKDGNTWHMIIGAAVNGAGGLVYYTSTDLLNWTYNPDFTSIPYSQMDIGSAIWEMPVFEPMGNGKYVLVVNPIGGTVGKYNPGKYTRAVYWTGAWQNGQFVPDYAQPKNLDLVHGHLSPTIERDYNGHLSAIGIVDERRSSQAQLDAGWAHLFSLPRTWYLLPDSKTLGQKPHPNVVNVRQHDAYSKQSDVEVNGILPLRGMGGKHTELVAYIDTAQTGNRYGLNFRVSSDREEYTSLYYDQQAKKLYFDKSQSTLSPADEEKLLLSGSYDVKAFGKPYKFQVFLDGSVVDVFINDAAAFSARIYPTLEHSNGVELYAEGGATTFTSVEGWGVKQAVPTPVAAPTGYNYLHYDFETGDLHDLIISGQAFSLADITQENNWSWGGPFNQQERHHLWGFTDGGDGQTGELRTPDFILGGDGKISLLLGGGNDIEHLYVALVRASDGVELLKVTGREEEAYQRVTLDAGPYVGTACYLKAVDNATGGFGHLNLDDIRIPVAVAVQSIALRETALSLPVGEQAVLEAVLTPADATKTSITWASSNESVAVVDASGNVTALAEGTATITASTQGSSHSASADITVSAPVTSGYLKYDFEQGGLSDLVVTGQAFSVGDVTADTNWGWGGPFHQQGQRHLWGFKEGGDAQTGEIRTPPFILGGDGRISFLLSGGKDLEQLYVALVRSADNAELMRLTALNEEGYAPKLFEAQAYVGETLYLRIVDNATEGFGHLNIDNIVIPVRQGPTVASTGEPGETRVSTFAAFPNPARQQLRLNLQDFGQEQVTIEILDLQGRRLLQKQGRREAMPTLKLPSSVRTGEVYIIRVQGRHRVSTQRILIE